jgi:hypothetical protein
MTNDKENHMTPAANLLIILAREVTSAERQLEQGPLYWANSTVERVTRDLAEGNSMNCLGELQGTAAGFDVAVATLEVSARAFESALRALESVELTLDEDDWISTIIAHSPRLAAIQDRLVKERAK